MDGLYSAALRTDKSEVVIAKRFVSARGWGSRAAAELGRQQKLLPEWNIHLRRLLTRSGTLLLVTRVQKHGRPADRNLLRYMCRNQLAKVIAMRDLFISWQALSPVVPG